MASVHTRIRPTARVRDGLTGVTMNVSVKTGKRENTSAITGKQ